MPALKVNVFFVQPRALDGFARVPGHPAVLDNVLLNDIHNYDELGGAINARFPPDWLIRLNVDAGSGFFYVVVNDGLSHAAGSGEVPASGRAYYHVARFNDVSTVVFEVTWSSE